MRARGLVVLEEMRERHWKNLSCLLLKMLTKLSSHICPEGIEARGPGGFVLGEDGDWETPLVNGLECAYVIFDENEHAKCGIEAAHLDGKLDWKKTIVLPFVSSARDRVFQVDRC